VVGGRLLTLGLPGQIPILARREIGGIALELSCIDRVLGTSAAGDCPVGNEKPAAHREHA
jgi:hypothetical protein